MPEITCPKCKGTRKILNLFIFGLKDCPLCVDKGTGKPTGKIWIDAGSGP